MAKSAKQKRTRPRAGGTVAELGDLKRAFADQIRAHEEQKRLAREARLASERQALQREREAKEFAEEFVDITPLKDTNRVVPSKQPTAPVARQRNLDESDALRSTLSDEIDLAQYLESDDALSYSAPGVGPDVTGRLRRGAWSISAQIDLHGLRRDEAREALVHFLDDCRASTKRCVRVIHGKGLGSVNREPVLKDKVRKWLVQRKDVLAFCQTAPNDGGSGALLVLLAGR